MKCLLVGGAGFIGSWLTKYLTDKGYKVIIIDPQLDLGANKLVLKKVRDFRSNTLLNKATIYKRKFEDIGEKIIKKEKPNICIHLAGYPLEQQFDSHFSVKQLSEDILLTHQVVSAVKKHKVKKFIFLSSIATYGHMDISVNEKAPIQPVTVYGISKASCEFLTTMHLDNWVIVRSTNVYGFGDLHKRVTNTIVNSALQKKKFWINERAWVDFIYIKDLVEGIYKVIEAAPVKEIFHVSGGKAQKLSAFIKCLKPYFDLIYVVRNLKDKPTRGTMENTKARMFLGWSPKMTLEEGIKDYLNYVKKYKFA